MKRLNFFLAIIMIASLAISCNSNDKQKESEPETTADTTQSPVVIEGPKVVDKTKVSVFNVAPSDTSILRRVKEIYVNSNGEQLGAAYGFRRNESNGMVVVEKAGSSLITLQQKSGSGDNAVYSDGKVTWALSGKEATLTQNNKTEKFIKQ